MGVLRSLLARPQVPLLKEIFREVIAIMQADPNSYFFRLPVLKRDLPDYYSVIKKPMDLAQMAKKARNGQYKTPEQFLADVDRIRSNAHRYNEDRNPIVTEQADKLLELCKQELEQRKAQINNALRTS